VAGVQHRTLVAFRLPRRTSDADLSASLAAAGYSLEEGDSVRHRDTYLDTQDGRLYCAGLRLRLRRDRDIWQLLEEGLLVAEQPALDEETF